MSNNDKPSTYIFIAHTRAASVYADLFEISSLALVVLLAYGLDSTFLAIFGACIWLAVFMSKGIGYAQRNRKTPQEAADYLKAEYGVTAK